MSISGNPIRVLRIINRFNLGGPTFNVAYLTRYMDDRFETLLLGGAKDESEASSEFILSDLGIEPVTISAMKRAISPYDDWKSYQEIKEVIRQFKPDIVHTHASKSGTLGRLAAIHMNVPIILHTFHGHVFHSYFGKVKTTIYKLIERWLAARSTKIVAISNIQKHELSTIHRIARPDKFEVVPLGFDLSRFNQHQEVKRQRFRQRFQLEANEVAIGIIGRLVPVKNHSLFLRAVEKLKNSYPTARFFIVGDGELSEQLKSICTELGIAYTIKSAPNEKAPLCFTSWIREVDEVMAGLDIVALTSLNEGTPVSLIEAQSAGKPVVSTRVGGIEDIVSEDSSALLCDANDVVQLTSHLARLIEDPELRTKMGQAGRALVNTKFTYQRLVDDMENLYTRLLPKNNQP